MGEGVGYNPDTRRYSRQERALLVEAVVVSVLLRVAALEIARKQVRKAARRRELGDASSALVADLVGAANSTAQRRVVSNAFTELIQTNPESAVLVYGATRAHFIRGEMNRSQYPDNAHPLRSNREARVFLGLPERGSVLQGIHREPVKS